MMSKLLAASSETLALWILALTGGLLFGALAKEQREKFLLAAEGMGDTFALVTWIIFGVTVVGNAIGHFDWRIVLYAVLSLTVIRMLPVFVSLTGTGLNTEAKLFIGWFGPRGLASIVFAVIVLDAELPNGGTTAMIAACTIIFSIIAHGVTANPWANAFGGRSQISNAT